MEVKMSHEVNQATNVGFGASYMVGVLINLAGFNWPTIALMLILGLPKFLIELLNLIKRLKNKHK